MRQCPTWAALVALGQTPVCGEELSALSSKLDQLLRAALHAQIEPVEGVAPLREQVLATVAVVRDVISVYRVGSDEPVALVAATAALKASSEVLLGVIEQIETGYRTRL